MKNTFKFLGIIALVMIIGFTITACNNSNDPPGSSIDPEVLISGRFRNATNTADVLFLLNKASNSSSSSQRASLGTPTSIPVSGRLYDGGITFNLSGTIDQETFTYSVSASSSMIRYTINGAFDSSWNPIGATATLAVRIADDDWRPFTFPVVLDNTINITGAVTEEPETGGIPLNLRGFWHFSENLDCGGRNEGRMLVTQWNISLDSVRIDLDGTRHPPDSMMVTVIERDGSDTDFDLILTYPLYRARNENELAAAVNAFFVGKGITPEKKNDWSDIVWGAGPQFFIDKDDRGNYYIHWINFTENQWRLIDQYYRSRHEEAFLIDRGVQPRPVFEKHRVELVQGDLKWSIYSILRTDDPNEEGVAHTWYDGMFDTLAEARAANDLDPEYIVLTR
ncbi:MAG: hypothetical protein FWD87_06640 [Spirochaetaceae bacterium]|nr:hypothetical protein [Spirochaetaceae bacterium]